MERVQAFAGFAIFASFDGYAPDTEDLILIAEEKVADKVAEFLNEEPGRWGCLAAVDGYEWKKSFEVRPCLRLVSEEFQTDFDKIVDQVKALEEE
jgi:hypothetical protein